MGAALKLQTLIFPPAWSAIYLSVQFWRRPLCRCLPSLIQYIMELNGNCVVVRKALKYFWKLIETLFWAVSCRDFLFPNMSKGACWGDSDLVWITPSCLSSEVFWGRWTWRRPQRMCCKDYISNKAWIQDPPGGIGNWGWGEGRLEYLALACCHCNPSSDEQKQVSGWLLLLLLGFFVCLFVFYQIATTKYIILQKEKQIYQDAHTDTSKYGSVDKAAHNKVCALWPIMQGS